MTIRDDAPGTTGLQPNHLQEVAWRVRICHFGVKYKSLMMAVVSFSFFYSSFNSRRCFCSLRKKNMDRLLERTANALWTRIAESIVQLHDSPECHWQAQMPTCAKHEAPHCALGHILFEETIRGHHLEDLNSEQILEKARTVICAVNPSRSQLSWAAATITDIYVNIVQLHILLSSNFPRKWKAEFALDSYIVMNCADLGQETSHCCLPELSVLSDDGRWLTLCAPRTSQVTAVMVEQCCCMQCGTPEAVELPCGCSFCGTCKSYILYDENLDTFRCPSCESLIRELKNGKGCWWSCNDEVYTDTEELTNKTQRRRSTILWTLKQAQHQTRSFALKSHNSAFW